MAPVPLPDVPCVRVRMVGKDATNNDWGIRFYLSYAGSAPTGANCTTLAGDIMSALGGALQPLISESTTVTECDVLDIATSSGLSGQSTAAFAGTRAGTPLPAQVAFNLEYGIARRYRGGKPRTYLPVGVDSDMADVANWSNSFVNAVNAAVIAGFAAIEALSVGAMGALKHVNLSYYAGYQNIEIAGRRAKVIPLYRATALHDNITGYFGKLELSSQRRRRTATTP